MIELPKQIPVTTIDELFKLLIPEAIKKGSRLDLGITLRETGLELNAMSHFIRMTDRCYGHLSPGGLKHYQKNQEAKLQISQIKPGSREWVFLKTISESADAKVFSVLSLVLKGLPHLKSSSKMTSRTGDKALRDRQRNLLLAKYHIRIYKYLSEDVVLTALSDDCRNKLSNLLSDLYVREHRFLSSAIRFSTTCVESVSLKMLTPIDKASGLSGRVYLTRPITATLIQGGRSYSSQMIEYSANGAGLSLLIMDISQDNQAKIVQNSQDISVCIGEKKCTGSIIHRSQRGIGLYLGIQLRYPVQNWDALIH